MAIRSLGHIGSDHANAMQIVKTDIETEIRLTGEEFLEILRKHFKRNVTGFVILNPDPSPRGKIFRQAVVYPLDKENFIGNIRSLRETVKSVKGYLNLSEARWAVNNWKEWLRFVDTHNRLPKGEYGSEKERGILR